MPEHEFRLTALLRALENDTYLAEALFFHEVSTLGDNKDALLGALRVNARHVLQSLSPLELFRRHQAGTPEVRTLTLSLDPPGCAVAWREPLELTVPVVHWAHGTDALVAYVPALGIEVVAPSAEEMEERLPRHVRAALLRGKHLSLARLLRFQRAGALELETVECPVYLPTPKQRAEEEAEERNRQKSVLD